MWSSQWCTNFDKLTLFNYTHLYRINSRIPRFQRNWRHIIRWQTERESAFSSHSLWWREITDATILGKVLNCCRWATIIVLCEFLTSSRDVWPTCGLMDYLLHRPGRGAEYCDKRVCPSVCPRVYLRNNTSELYQIFCTAWCRWPWLGTLLAALQYVITSGFVDDVIFPIMSVLYLIEVALLQPK